MQNVVCERVERISIILSELSINEVYSVTKN
jgi:hypothetical protein